MKNLLSILLISFVLLSCGNDPDKRTTGEYLSAFVKANPTIVTFGKVDLKTILDKAEYKKVPKLGLILNGYLNELKGGVKLETPIHFALEGPFLEDGTPKTVFAFIETINADTLASKITQQGYDIRKVDGMHYFSEGDMAVGVKNNLTIVITKRQQFDAKRLLSKAFDDVRKGLSEGKVDQILEEDADLVAGVSMQNMYTTSNTDLKGLSKDKKKQIVDMVSDSYILTTLNFEEGQVWMDTRNLFSETMNSKMFMKEDDGAGILNRLGSGKPILGFSMNFDMRKMEDFLNTYSPNTLKELGETLGGPTSLMLAMGGDHVLSNLLTGELGGVMIGEPDMEEGLSDFNFFIGLGKQGKTLAQDGISFLDAMGMQEVKLDQAGLSVSSNKMYSASTGGKLTLPKGCDEFGTKGLHFFLDLENVDLGSFEFENEQKIIYLIKSVYFEMDNEGSRLVIQSRKEDGNMLKQVVDFFFKELEAKIGGIPS